MILEENGFIKIHKDQSITLKEELSEASGTFGIIERIREEGLAYRTEVEVVRDLINGEFHHPRVLKELSEVEIDGNKARRALENLKNFSVSIMHLFMNDFVFMNLLKCQLFYNLWHFLSFVHQTIEQNDLKIHLHTS